MPYLLYMLAWLGLASDLASFWQALASAAARNLVDGFRARFLQCKVKSTVLVWLMAHHTMAGLPNSGMARIAHNIIVHSSLRSGFSTSSVTTTIDMKGRPSSSPECFSRAEIHCCRFVWILLSANRCMEDFGSAGLRLLVRFLDAMFMAEVSTFSSRTFVACNLSVQSSH